MIRIGSLGRIGFLIVLFMASPVSARDVAFVEPGNTAGSATPDEAFKIEPKSEIDIGDSILNIVRRETFFFVNQTPAPIKIEKVALSSDSTVSPQIVNDDCSKEATLPPLSRCSIELSITPTGPGAWGIELLMTHDGPGRITRARIVGKTGGSDAGDKKERGLSLSNKDAKPIDFGEVAVGEGKVVRTALMVNDSPAPITLYSVDVIEADKSLQRLDQGCSADMDLKPGESCPVTLVWTPTSHGMISTDLIIRHSGQLGFAVISIRGTAKGGDKDSDAAMTSSKPSNASHAEISNLPPPPSPAQVAKEVAKATEPVHASALHASSAATGSLHLIGTVGNHAVFLKPDGTTAVVQLGDQADLGDSSPATIESIGARDAVVSVNGKKKTYTLQAVQELKDQAMASQSASGSGKGENSVSGAKDSKDNKDNGGGTP